MIVKSLPRNSLSLVDTPSLSWEIRGGKQANSIK